MASEEYKVDDIRPSRLNPRRNFNQEKLEELAASIGEMGVKEPILIRRTSLWAQACEWVNACGKGAKLSMTAFREARFEKRDWERVVKALEADGRVSDGGRYAIVEDPKPFDLLDARLGEPFLEIVAGERRWRASKMAGKATIPAILEGAMTDAEALEIALLENNQRDDLLPCEEAEGFAMHMKISKRTASEVARRVGKSESYVRKRVMLCRLPDDFKQAVDEGRVTLNTAFIVARVPDPLITECAGAVLKGWGNQPMTEEQVRNTVMNKYMTDLSAAPFKTEDATLVPEAGACGPCRFRTGNDPGLFDDIVKKSICANTDCFARKVKADMQRKVEAAKQEGLKIMDPKEAKKELEYGRISYGSKYVDLKESHCQADPKGRSYGRIIGKDVKPIVAVDPGNRVHYLLPKKEADELVKKTLKLKDKAPASGSSSSSSHDDTYKKQQEAVRRRKEAAVKARELAAAAVGQFMPKLTPDSHKVFRAMLVHTIGHTGHDAIKDALARRPMNGVNKNDYHAPRQAAAWAASAAVNEVFAFTVDVILAAGLGSYTWHYGGKEIQPEAALIFDALGIDIAAIEKEVTKAANEKKKAAEAKKAEREAKKALKTKAKSGNGKDAARTAPRPAAKAKTKAKAAGANQGRRRSQS